MKYCSTKNEQVIKITSNKSKSDNKTILAIKNDTDWRKLREAHDSRENLDKLLNPAAFHERVLWKNSDLNDANLEDLPDFPAKTGMYSWTKQGAGGKNKRDFRGQVGMGGGEKDRFTVQLSVITKSGKH